MARVVTLQHDHVVLKCSGATCGMRYPSPDNDPRREACPLCEAPVSEVGRYPAAPSWELAGSVPGGELVAVLDNIRSALNVGAMMRSADGAALNHVYLGGLTAGVDNPKVIKTALGAEREVPATSFKDTLECLDLLRAADHEIWAIEYTSDSVALQEIDARPEKLAFVVGNERSGVDPDILANANRHVHIDMHGSKTTLNVGVAFGIAAYQLRSVPIAGASG